MMSAPLIGHGQDTPDTFNRGSLGFNSDRVPSNYHSRDFIRRPNLNQSDSVSSNGGCPPLNPVSEFTSLSRPDPKYADYSLKQKRVESYRNWPPSAKQKPENLVDAGFFYTGQADSVRCYLCGTGLRNWDPEDEPWVEHARWAPECFYVRDNKGQEFINLVQVAVRQQQMVGGLI